MRRHAARDAEGAAGEIDARRIGEELGLEGAERRGTAPAATRQREEPAKPREQDVEVERRIQKVVWIQVAVRERRARAT